MTTTNETGCPYGCEHFADDDSRCDSCNEVAARLAAIAELETRKAVYVRREARSPGLWWMEIQDCDLSLARLRAGLDLTRHARGLPS